MREILLRLQGPTVAILIETEAVTRVATFADLADLPRLQWWLEQSRARSSALAYALADSGVLDGSGRGREWSRELAGDPGGIVGALESLLADAGRDVR